MALTPGARLGHYEIVALIGAGGMGEVFEARDPRLGQLIGTHVWGQFLKDYKPAPW